MMKKLFLTILTIFVAVGINAQTVYTMQNDSIVLDCTIGGVLHDPGGPAASYGNNQSFFYTVCPSSPTEAIAFDFDSASFGDGDYVCVYDGTNNFAPLLECYNNVNPITLNQITRATVSNTSRCLTFQFYSDAALIGDFEIELYCLAPCQNIEAQIASTIPPINPIDTTYIDLCFNEDLILTGSALYSDNDTYYHQSNATSTFYWKVGNVLDTNLVFSLPLENAGFYPVELTVEDSVGCFSTNERNLVVRYIPRPEFSPFFDSTLCYGEYANFYDVVAGENIGGNVIIGDTVRTSSIFSVTSAAQYIPDDADGISGNGISTPATYSVNVTGFIPGSTITNGNQVEQICLDIEHSFAGDIDIVLVAPNGSQVFLVDMNPPSGPASDYGTPVVGVNPNQPGTPATYCWSPTGTSVPIISGAAYPPMIPPFPATYQAAGNWNNFIGSPVNGTWTIQVFDDYGGDDGNIFGASFAFDSAFIPPPDSFIVAYDAIGNWISDPLITSTNLNQNSINYFAGSAGANTLVYTTTSDFGCNESDTLHFWVDSFQVVATPSDTVICQGDPVQLSTAVNNATGALTYNWSPPTDLNASNISNPITTISSVPIVYTVAVTNSNACTFYDTVDVQTESLFEFSAMSDTFICFGDSVQLWAAGGAISYDWTPNDGTISDTLSATPIVSPITTTTYTVKADSTGCSQYANIVVSVSNITAFLIPPTNPSCGLSDGSILIFGNGGVGPLTYSNDGGLTFQATGVFNNLGAGVYPMVISDGTGCDYLDTVTLSGGAPLVIDSVIAIDPSCGVVGSINAILTDPLLAVTYTLNVGPISQDTSLFTGLNGGTYTITIDDGVCPTIDTTVTLLGGISVVVSVDSSSNSSCFNAADGAIHLSASGGSTYNFSIDGVNYLPTGSFNNLDTGTYTVYVEELGCIDSTTVTLTQPDSLVFTSVIDSLLCFGDNANITITASGGTMPYLYSIDGIPTFATTNNFVVPGGNYTIQVMDSNNCLSVIELDTIDEPTQLVLTLDSTLTANCSLSDGAIYTSVSGGVSPYTFTIDNGISTQDSTTFNLLPTGNYTVIVTDANGCTDLVTTFVQDDSSLAINVDNFVSVTCFGLTDASVQLSGSGGTAPYTFNIDGGLFQADSLFTNLSGGLHTFMIEDVNGCTEPVIFTVFEPTALTTSFTTDSLLCDESANGEIHISAFGGSAPYFYAVDDTSTAQLTGDFLNLDAGMYTGFVMDVNGCLDTITPINVFQPDTFIITNVSQNIECNGNTDGVFTVSTSGGTSAFQYNLNGGVNQNSNVFNTLGAGVYTINSTDANGCAASIIDSILEPSAIVFVLDSQLNVTCFNGNDGYLSFSTTGGVGLYTYSKDNGVSFQSSNVFGSLTAGVYDIVVKDANGCEENLNITITQADEIIITTSSTAVTCAGSTDGIVSINTVIGGNPPYSAIVNSNPPVPFAGSYSLGNLQGGINHTVQVVDAEGCTSIVQNVFVNEPDSLKLVPQSINDVSCFSSGDGSVTLMAQDGTPAYTFTINVNGNLLTQTGSNSAYFDNLSGGQYPIFLTDANNCLDSMTVLLLEPSALIIDSLQILSQITCFGDDNGSILAHPSGGTPYASPSEPYTYSWSPSGDTEHKAGPLGSGVHTVTVTDANGCTTTASETILPVDPVLANINPDSAFMSMGDTLQLGVNVQNAIGNNLQYSWSPTNGLSCTDCANPTVTIYNDIAYSVVVTDSNSCTNYNYTEVFIGIDASLFFFIPNGFTPNGDGINDVFEVYGQDIKTVEMSVFNRWGEKVFHGTNQFESWDGTFNGVLQGNGVYSYAIDVTFLNDAQLNKKGSLSLVK